MLHSGGSTILVYLKISRECFVLLLIMMNSEQDKDAAIRTYTGNPKFRDLLKKILGGSDTRKKVENFLGGGEMVAQHDYQKDPQYMKNVMEIINTPGYDPQSVEEAKRQLRQMQLGLPRFPKA